MDAQKSKKGAPMDKKKLIVIAVIVVILLLNVLWTVLQDKFTPKVAEVHAGLAALEGRVAKLEQGGLPDVADLREQFSSLKDISAKYGERLGELLKSEEEQLAGLEAQVEAQKARVEALKKHLAPAD